MTPRELIRNWKRDYIPSGSPVRSICNLRPATGLERCSVAVGDEIQSGPLYCGELADVVADVSGKLRCHIAACNRHKDSLEDLERTDKDNGANI